MDDLQRRRQQFVDGLRGIASDLDSGDAERVGPARASLARLRRGLQNRPRAGALALRGAVPSMDVEIHRHQPPEREIEAWQLVGGLFALNPAWRPGRTLARVLGALPQNDAVEARMRRLLAADTTSLPFYLRQAVELVKPEPLDYGLLLPDVVTLTAEQADPERAYRVRLRWARDFHRDRYGDRTTSTDNQRGETE